MRRDPALSWPSMTLSSVLVDGSATGTLSWSPTGQHSGMKFTVNTNPSNGTVTVSQNYQRAARRR